MTLEGERALFEACLAVAEIDREGWLEANCHDGAMRERVRRLLRAHDAAERGEGFREDLARSADGPRSIGRFRLLEKVGEGGIGEVFLAEQSSPVARRVALKLIKRGMDSREVIARFEAERQTLAILSHPGIAQIYDAGTTDDGRPYFVMEYVPGLPLTRYCDNRRLSLGQRLELFLETCDGVQHAHQKGIIHRDLKPSNLLVAERDGRAAVKIIDFGVAKATTPGLQPSAAYTRIGYLVGTPEYMSPEQAQLSPLDVDTRTDVYSLGVVLYQLLVGALPYQLTGDSATPAQIMNELLASEIRAPSAVLGRDAARAEEAATHCGMSTRQLRAAIREELDWIVLKALARERSQRYASVAELAADIRRHLANEPVLAGPPSAAYRIRKFAVRHRVGVAAVAGLFFAAVAFGIAMALQARELARERDEARFQAARAEASSEFMSLMLEQVGPDGRPMTMVELLDAGLDLLERQYQGDPRFVARMLLQMSRRYMDLQNTARQRDLVLRAEGIARRLGDDELLARANCALVPTLIDENARAEAGARLAMARTALDHVARPSVESQVDCLRAEAEVLRAGPDHRAALHVLRKARTLLESSDYTRGLAYTATLTDIGAVHFRAGEIRECLEVTERVRDALERNGRGGTLAMVITIGNLGQVHYRLGEILDAAELGRQSLERVRVIEHDRPLAPSQSVGYAITLLRLGHAADAEPLLADALRVFRSTNNEFWTARAAFHHGRALLALGRTVEGEVDLDSASRWWNADALANRDFLADLDVARAERNLALGRIVEARALMASLLKRMEFPEHREGAGLAAALRTAARAELLGHSPSIAGEYARAALEISERVAREPARSADVGEALLLLGLAEHELGHDAEALATLRRAQVSLTNGVGADHGLTLEASRATVALQGA